MAGCSDCRCILTRVFFSVEPQAPRAEIPAHGFAGRIHQIVLCEWLLRRFNSVEGPLWDDLFTASPRDFDGCAYALHQGDQTFTRLQHHINSTRRAFHTALKELERLEARDQDVVLVNPDPVSPVTQTPET